MPGYRFSTALHLIAVLLLFISCSSDDNGNDNNEDNATPTYTLSTVVQPPEGGAVTPSMGTYEEGEQIGIAATPSPDWVFKNWDGALTGTSNPAILTISGDVEVTAVFEPVDIDGDGVENDDDLCSDTPSGEIVDVNGCSDSQKDADNDGVSDADDLCANTPPGAIVGPIGCADIQVRLNQGETPLQIINSGVEMSELYGKTYQGGLIFYVNPNDGSGLVAAPGDLVGIAWWNGSVIVTGANDPSIGAGQANTSLIINAQGAGQYAASVCDSYVSGGFDDWFLPSLQELDAILNNLISSGLGNFGPTDWYWSSTQWTSNPAGAGFLNNELGSTFPGLITSGEVSVRPVRAF